MKRRDEKGMVLLLVLVVVALLSSLLVEFAFTTQVDLRLTETFRDSTRAYYLAKGGIEAGKVILTNPMVKNSAWDHPSELWGQVPPFPVKDGEFVSLEIEDESGKINLNMLVDQVNNPHVTFKDRLKRLFDDALNITNANTLVDDLADWIVAQRPPTLGKYTLSSIDELLMVDGFTPEIVAMLKPHVTVFGDYRLNVNTASIEVIYAWGNQNMTQSIAETIDQHRQTTPFASTSDLSSITGSSAFMWNSAGGVSDVTVQRSAFRSLSQADVNDGRRSVEAVVSRNGNTIFYLKVN